MLTALGNLVDDLLAQFKRRGALGRRLGCVLRYWGLYLKGRLAGLDRGESRLRALASLARRGDVRQVVEVEFESGLRAKLDLFSATFLAKEILDDGAYRRPGFEPRPGWTVVDVGAHQGLFTLEAARLVGPKGRVLSFEPFEFNRGLLASNLSENGLSWAELVPAAAAETAGSRELFVSPYSTGWQSLVLKEGDERVAVRIETDTVDRALAARGVSRADLIKVDVEGAWRLVFAGASKLLESRPRVVMEVEGGESEISAARAHLEGLGYAVETDGFMLFARPGGR